MKHATPLHVAPPKGGGETQRGLHSARYSETGVQRADATGAQRMMRRSAYSGFAVSFSLDFGMALLHSMALLKQRHKNQASNGVISP
jgi:hypothetical protein